ncbi:superoxide dismutase family protein [Actinophytocola sediminis]
MKPVARRVLTCLLGPALAATLSAGPAVAAADPYWLAVMGTFSPPSVLLMSNPVTYDPDRVPAGGSMTVTEFAEDDRTGVGLSVSGLQPNRDYGAHVHTSPCGNLPEDAGPHYQHLPDPVQPSTDPAYANQDNEVWLDFTTDETGHATASAKQDWRFRQGGANSVVLHDKHTSTEPGHAGEAGDRLACFTVRFR